MSGQQQADAAQKNANANEERVSKALEQSPFPDLIKSLGLSIAVAQGEMDKKAIEIAKEMADPNNGIPLKTGGKKSMLELGLAPTFYHFTETTISARVAFSSVEGHEWGVGASIGGGYPGIFFASVNAHYSSKYSFSADSSSEIKTKIVSVPAPGLLMEKINATS